MGKFDRCFLLSDVDGTLVYCGGVPKYNVERINYFIANGGTFTLATGRSVQACEDILKDIKSCGPIVALNGALGYDKRTDTVLYEKLLPDDIKSAVVKIANLKIDGLGIEIHSRCDIFDALVTREIELHNKYEKLNAKAVDVTEILDIPWNKMLFALEDEAYRPTLYKLLKEYGVSDEYIMNTNAFLDDGEHRYTELLPKGASKGDGVNKLIEIMKENKLITFGIGDYYNDVPLIEAVDYSAAPSGAPDDIKSLTDYVSLPAEEGAVGGFIDYIERMLLNER